MQKGPLLVWKFIQPTVGLFLKMLEKWSFSAVFGKNQGLPAGLSALSKGFAFSLNAIATAGIVSHFAFL